MIQLVDNQLLVASILNDFQVVLNGGVNKGIAKGQSFVIYDHGPEIFDPSTKVSLGRIELVRGRVYIIGVQDKLSIASTDMSDTSYSSQPLNGSILQLMKPKLMDVKVGDRAKRVS